MTIDFKAKMSTYLLVHLWVLKHRYELLEEALASDLLLECHSGAIHQDVEKAKREKDNSCLVEGETTKNLVCCCLCTTRETKKFC